MCSASYFLSGPNTWSDQSPKKSGQEIEFFSTPCWVIQILEDECALQLTLHRRRPEPCQRIKETPELAKKEEGKTSQIYQTTCDFTSKFSSSPTKQKKTKNHSSSYIHTHTHKRNFFKKEKKKPGSIFEGKRLFIAAKVLTFFSASGNYMRIGDFSREEIHSLVIT